MAFLKFFFDRGQPAAASEPEYWSDSRVCGDPEHEDETVTGADMVGDQLRGLVDPSGTPLHGCVVYILR